MKNIIAAIFVLLSCSAARFAVAAEYHVDQKSPTASDDNAGTPQRPWKTISKSAEVLQPGDTVVIHAGVYREHVQPARGGTAEAPITYCAADGEEVVLTGADVIDGWTAVGNGVWKKEPWTHRFPTHPNDEKHRLIGRCEQVICQAELLKQVERREEMPAGSFFADTDNKVLYVRLPGDRDPNQAKVEASVRPVCFGPRGSRAVDHLRLRGLTVRYAANKAQYGALAVRGDYWLVEDCLVEWTNGNGMSFAGDHAILRRIRSRDNGQQGLGGRGRNFLLEEVVLERNNRKGFDKGWEAGAMKIVYARDGVVRRCKALDNDGNGLWFDIDVRDVIVEECRCQRNAGHGIFVEISGGFTVRNNLCTDNGTDKSWGDAGIALGESNDCVIENNLCARNPNGVTLREQGPRVFKGISGKEVSYHIHDVIVRQNILANNSEYQIGLWYDNAFFGPHPSEKDGAKGPPLDPAKANLRFEKNFFWSEPKQQLALWGCPWRPGSKKYPQLAAWQEQQEQDAGSMFANPEFAATEKGDWSLRPTSPALRLQAGPQKLPVE